VRSTKKGPWVERGIFETAAASRFVDLNLALLLLDERVTAAIYFFIIAFNTTIEVETRVKFIFAVLFIRISIFLSLGLMTQLREVQITQMMDDGTRHQAPRRVAFKNRKPLH